MKERQDMKEKKEIKGIVKGIVKGIFRANEKGFGFVAIQKEDVQGNLIQLDEKKLEEVYIAKKNSKGALNGDLVLVKLIKEKEEDNTSSKNAEGKVLEILKHEKDTFVGTFEKSKNFGFVVPDDTKVSEDIFISKKNTMKARNKDKVVVKITKYSEKNKKAEGKVVEILGKVDQAGIDMLSLIKDYDLPYEFPEGVIKEAKSIEEEISEQEMKGRLDLRNEEIFTIDGEDAKDLDDAVYVKKLDNGNYELGVHIADVSHYVRENSKLDKEAILRGTSVYMLDRVIPMLPQELSNGICSLNQGKPRLTISVIMQINNEGQVVSSDIQKSVINVTRRMSYHEVSCLLGDDEKLYSKDCIKYIPHFKRMEELAKILKNRRDKQGSLNLDIPESKITLDENGYAVDVGKYELSFANEIIEQFMLTANETVAERFFWLEAPFIYRVHEVPDEDKIAELNKFLFNLGYKIKTSNGIIYPKAFAEVLEKVKGKDEEKVVSNLILRTLKVARYESENKGHFGIASKYYCHFTSPIRRYPDLFIHRIISYCIKNNYVITDEFKEKYLTQATEYAEQSSQREKIAQKVERDSEDIKKAEFMENKLGEIYEGIVSSITSFGMFVELENTVEGLVRFEDFDSDEYFIYNENAKTLIGQHSKKTYKIGDKVTIQVIKASKQLRQIDFKLVHLEAENEKENS